MNQLRFQGMVPLLLAGVLLSGVSASFFPALAQSSSTPNSKSVSPPQTSQSGTVPAKPAIAAPLPTVEKPSSANTPVKPMDPQGVDTPSDAPDDGTKAVRPVDPKASARKAYVIGPEDVLMVKVWQEPNLSGQVTVGSDGMISLQLIDEVRATGLTAEQLKGVITEKLKAFIVNPDVNIQLLRGNSQKFIIQGEVHRPGSFALTGPTTILEALVSGGGFLEFAKTKKIYVLRTSIDPKTNKPEIQKFNFNYPEVSHGKKVEQNIFIKNGDQIYVP